MSHRGSSHRVRSSSGSQVVEVHPELYHATGSSRNISMSRQEEKKLQLRLFSNKQASDEATGAATETKGGNQKALKAELYRGEHIRQASVPVRQREDKQTSNQSPNEISKMSPQNRPPLHPGSPSPQNYSPSTPNHQKIRTQPIGLPGTPPASLQLVTSTHELATLPNTPLGLTSAQSGHKSASRPDLQDIQRLRADVWNLRSQIHQMRASLREKQDVKAAADDILFRRITYMTARGLQLTETNVNPFPGQKSLKELMDDCQKARNEYGPLEDDCRDLEDRVSRQEFKLAQLEEQFYARPTESRKVSTNSHPSSDDDENSSSSSIASDEDEFETSEYHPLVNDYLSKLGDLDLMQERLDEFRDERAALEAEKQSRHRFGLTLDADDQEWLDDAEGEYAALTGKIQSLEKDLELLKAMCLSKNLIDEDGEPTSLQSQEDSYFMEEDMSAHDQISEYVKYPLLLPHPGKKHDDTEQNEPKPDLTSETPTTRINEWLLNKLRISPLDVSLLASTFESLHGKTSKDWQILVLNVWYEDDTIPTFSTPRPKQPESQSSMSTRHPDETSHSSNMSQEHMRGSLHFLLGPSTQSPSESSDDTERTFGMTGLNISRSLANGSIIYKGPTLDFTSRPGWT